MSNFTCLNKNSVDRQKLIQDNLHLVNQVVNRLSYLKSSEIEEEDLISYGIIGLIESVDKYEASKGCSFKAFAFPRIKGAIYDQLRFLDKLSRTSRKRIKQLHACTQELEQELKASPSDKQIAERMKISLKELQRIQYEASAITLSLDASVSNDSEDAWIEQISDKALNPEESCEQKSYYEILTKCVEALPEREKMVIGLYHYRKMTMKEIATILKVSESRACQIHNRGISLLRSKLLAQFS
jgi:RNA polymerase sigma factor FliA